MGGGDVVCVGGGDLVCVAAVQLARALVMMTTTTPRWRHRQVTAKISSHYVQCSQVSAGHTVAVFGTQDVGTYTSTALGSLTLAIFASRVY